MKKRREKTRLSLKRMIWIYIKTFSKWQRIETDVRRSRNLIFVEQYNQYPWPWKGDPTFALAAIAPAMISPTTESHRVRVIIGFLVRGRVRIKSFPRQTWRIGPPISVSITLGHASAECSESYSRGLVHWYSYVCSTSLLHSWMSSVWQEMSRYHF